MQIKTWKDWLLMALLSFALIMMITGMFGACTIHKHYHTTSNDCVKIPDWLKCEKGGSHESNGIVFTSYPPKYTCSKCGNMYSEPLPYNVKLGGDLIENYSIIQLDTLKIIDTSYRVLTYDFVKKTFAYDTLKRFIRLGNTFNENTVIQGGNTFPIYLSDTLKKPM